MLHVDNINVDNVVNLLQLANLVNSVAIVISLLMEYGYMLIILFIC